MLNQCLIRAACRQRDGGRFGKRNVGRHFCDQVLRGYSVFGKCTCAFFDDRRLPINIVTHVQMLHVFSYFHYCTREEIVKDFDAVLDTVGGDIYQKSFKVLKRNGILVSMLSMPDEMLMKKYHVRAVLETTKVDSKKLGKITDLIKAGTLKVNIANVYSLQQTQEAFKAKEKEKVLGKIAIEVKKPFS